MVAVSADDAHLVSKQFGQPCVDVVENGIDRHFLRGRTAAAGTQAGRFVFGSIDWRPNRDAVAWLLDDLLPRVLAQEPEVELCIVGRSPSGQALSNA